MIDTIIFDLDGTLLYTLEDLTDSVNYTLEKFNRPCKSINEIRAAVGNGVEKLLENVLPKEIIFEDMTSINKNGHLKAKETKKQQHIQETMSNNNNSKTEKFNLILSEFKKHYKNNMYNKTKPYDGIIDLINKLEDSGIKTAILSNKFDSAVKELAKKYFPNKFTIAVGESAIVKKKPNPDGVRFILEELKSNIQNTIIVGDSEVDIQTGKNSGIEVISVAWGYKDINFLENAGATTIVHNTNQLLDEIKKINTISL